MQHDLNNIYKWTETNNMCLNSYKFKHLKYGKNSDLREISVYLTNESSVIENKNFVKNLGVLISQDCSFSEQINKVVDISSWILQTFVSNEKHILLTLWKA